MGKENTKTHAEPQDKSSGGEIDRRIYFSKPKTSGVGIVGFFFVQMMVLLSMIIEVFFFKYQFLFSANEMLSFAIIAYIPFVFVSEIVVWNAFIKNNPRAVLLTSTVQMIVLALLYIWVDISSKMEIKI